MQKFLFTSGRVEIYTDKIHLVQIGLFFRSKTTAIPLSEIKHVSAPFEVLKIETTRGAKYNLRFWDHLRAFIAHNAIKKAMKDAR
jgi:hypothetical protein